MLKRIFAVGTVLLLVLSSASAKMTVEEKEFRLINTFLALQIYLSQIRTADHLMTFENLKNFKLPAYDADAIVKDFRSNKSAATKKYSSPFNVNGIVSTVKHIHDNPEIGLQTTKSNKTAFVGVLGKEYNGFNQPLKAGTYFPLTCRSAIFDNIVYANGCAPEVGSLIVEENQAAQITKYFLKGKDISQFIVSNRGEAVTTRLFILKYIAQYAPDNSPCFAWETSEKCNFADFLPFKGNIRDTKEFKQAYEKGKNFYHLPQFNRNYFILVYIVFR